MAWVREWIGKRKGLVGLFAFSLVSFIARLIFLNDGLFHHDSVQLAVATEKTVETGETHAAVHGRYGLVLLYALAFAPFRYLAGVESSALVITVMTALLSSLAVGMLYLFAFRLTGKWFAGFCAALLLSLNPVFFSVTTYAKSHGPALLFVLLSGYALLRGLEEKGLKWWIVSITSGLFSLLVRGDSVLFLAMFGVLALVSSRLSLPIKASKLQKILFFGMLFMGILAMIPLGLFSVSEAEGIPFSNIPHLLNLLITSSLMLLPSLGFLASLGVVISGAWLAWKRQWWLLGFLILWFGMVFLPLGTTNVASPRHYVGSFVPLFIMLGLGLDALRRKKAWIAWAALVVIVVHGFSLIYPVVDLRHEYSGPKEYGLFVERVAPPDSVIIENDNAVFVSYYGHRETMGYPRMPSREQVEETVRQIHGHLDAGRPVYVSSRIFSLDERNSPALTLQANFNIRKVGELKTEDYHRAELRLRPVDRTFYELGKKEGMTAENVFPYYFK